MESSKGLLFWNESVIWGLEAEIWSWRRENPPKAWAKSQKTPVEKLDLWQHYTSFNARFCFVGMLVIFHWHWSLETFLVYQLAECSVETWIQRFSDPLIVIAHIYGKAENGHFCRRFPHPIRDASLAALNVLAPRQSLAAHIISYNNPLPSLPPSCHSLGGPSGTPHLVSFLQPADPQVSNGLPSHYGRLIFSHEPPVEDEMSSHLYHPSLSLPTVISSLEPLTPPSLPRCC